jgi:hypothetical protein
MRTSLAVFDRLIYCIRLDESILMNLTTSTTRPIEAMTSYIRKSLTLAILTLALTAVPVRSQNTFEPFPRDLASKYHFDLARNFFATPEAAEADRKTLYKALEDFGQWRGKLSASAENLYRAFQAFELLQAKINLHLSSLSNCFQIQPKNEMVLRSRN